MNVQIAGVGLHLPSHIETAVQEEKIKRGDLVYFFGTGAGFSATSALITY